MLEKVKRRKVEGIKIKRQQTKAPSPLERAGAEAFNTNFYALKEASRFIAKNLNRIQMATFSFLGIKAALGPALNQ